MEETKSIGIANTGPIVSALQCGRIDLLQRYFTVLHIPSTELEEYSRHQASPFVEALIALGFIVVHELNASEKEKARQIAEEIAESSLAQVKDSSYHYPEAEAMVMMDRLELRAEVLLVDELAVREVSEKHGVPYVGFAGVLIQACDEGALELEEVQRIAAGLSDARHHVLQ